MFGALGYRRVLNDAGFTREEWQRKWMLGQARTIQRLRIMVSAGTMIRGYRMVERAGNGWHKTPVYRLSTDGKHD